MPSPPSPVSQRTINIADLLNRPGASRQLDLSFDPPEDVGSDIGNITGPLRLTGVVESVVDGLLIRGTVMIPLQLSCARCLKPLSAEVVTDVTELFSDPRRVDDADEVESGYEIRDTVLDLDTLLRDAVVPAVPYRPLCDEACRGLCPTCGVDLNEAGCDCADVSSDPRWAALEGLRLPDSEHQE